MTNYLVAQLNEIGPVACPCGSTRRAFAGTEGAPASVHVLEVSADSRVHYHKRLTQIYVVLAGSGHLELDGRRVPLRPMTAVLIRPGCRHRAVGRLRVLNVVIPPFDPADEWLDDGA